MKLISIARYNKCFNKYLLKISEIIEQPDYIGINPNEIGTSFELVKSYDDIIQLEIKLDELNGYLYVATLYTITPSKLQHNINNGRLKQIDK